MSRKLLGAPHIQLGCQLDFTRPTRVTVIRSVMLNMLVAAVFLYLVWYIVKDS